MVSFPLVRKRPAVFRAKTGFSLLVSVSCVVFLSNASKAGFEWIPPQPKPEAPVVLPAEDQPSDMAPSPEMSDSLDEKTFLPVLDTAQEGGAQPEAASTEDLLPEMGTAEAPSDDMEAQTSSSEITEMQSPEAPAMERGVSEIVKDISEDSGPTTPVPLAAEIQTPENQETLPSAPVHQNLRIVLPDNAPESARASLAGMGQVESLAASANPDPAVTSDTDQALSVEVFEEEAFFAEMQAEQEAVAPVASESKIETGAEEAPVAMTAKSSEETVMQDSVTATKSEASQPSESRMEMQAADLQDAVSPPQNEISEYETAVGFGSDMPMALALRQIVPPAYAFSFHRDVNPGQRISWNGGKPWNEVLTEALSPHSLKAVLVGKTVSIRPVGTLSEKSNPDGALLKEGNDQTQTTPDKGDSADQASLQSSDMTQEPTLLARNNITDPGHDSPRTHDQVSSQPEENAESASYLPAQASASLPMKSSPDMKTAAALQENGGGPVSLLPSDAKTLEKEEMENLQGLPETQAETNSTDAPVSELSRIEVSSGQALEAHEVETRAPSSKSLTEPLALQAKKGDSLKETVERWADAADAEIVWNATRDYEVALDVVPQADLNAALETLFSLALKDASGEPYYRLILSGDNGEESVLIIEDM